MGQLLFYDDKEMHVYDCTIQKIELPEKIEFDATSLEDDARQTIYMSGSTAYASFCIVETMAELDPTMMKRIARYNLDSEFKLLNSKIKEAKDKIKSLDAEMKEKEKKLDFIQSIVNTIWQDEYFEEDRYVPSNDYDELDW